MGEWVSGCVGEWWVGEWVSGWVSGVGEWVSG